MQVVKQIFGRCVFWSCFGCLIFFLPAAARAQAFLGVTLSQPPKEFVDTAGSPVEGGYVLKVLEGSPAEKAGLKVGDLIVRLDREAIESFGEVVQILSEKKVRQRVRLWILRRPNPKLLEIVVRLGERPEFLKSRDERKEDRENRPGPPKISPGVQAPDFVAVDLDGRPVRLSAFRGKWVLLDFWATWCAPCLAEIPYLLQARNQFSGLPLEFLSVNLDYDRSRLAQFVLEKKLPFRQIFSSRGWEDDLVKLYGVDGIPAIFLINPDGQIAAVDLRQSSILQVLTAIFNRPEYVTDTPGKVSGRPGFRIESITFGGESGAGSFRFENADGVFSRGGREVRLPGMRTAFGPEDRLPETEKDFVFGLRKAQMPVSPFGGRWTYVKSPGHFSYTLNAYDTAGVLKFTFHSANGDGPVFYDLLDAGTVLGEAKENLLWSAPWETNVLGVMAAKALREYARADIGLFNAYGMRGNIPKGPIREAHIPHVFIRANQVALLRLKGADLMAVLARGLDARWWLYTSGVTSSLQYAEAGIPEFSAVLEDGTAVNLSKTYSVAVPSYLAAGGDGFWPFLNARRKKFPPAGIQDIMAEYFKKHSPLP